MEVPSDRSLQCCRVMFHASEAFSDLAGFSLPRRYSSLPSRAPQVKFPLRFFVSLVLRLHRLLALPSKPSTLKPATQKARCRGGLSCLNDPEPRGHRQITSYNYVNISSMYMTPACEDKIRGRHGRSKEPPPGHFLARRSRPEAQQNFARDVSKSLEKR